MCNRMRVIWLRSDPTRRVAKLAGGLGMRAGSHSRHSLEKNECWIDLQCVVWESLHTEAFEAVDQPGSSVWLRRLVL